MCRKLLTLLLILITLELFSYNVVLKPHLELNGKIIRNKSKQLYFLDDRLPKVLIIINHNQIKNINKNKENITEKLLNSEIDKYINYNKFSKEINLATIADQEKIEALLHPKPLFDTKIIMSAKISYETRGNWSIGAIDKSIENGFSGSIELLYKYDNFIDIGLGSMYLLPRGLKNDSKTFNNYGFYSLCRVHGNIEKFPLYLFGNLGISFSDGSFFDDNLDNKPGLLSAIGIGFEAGKLLVELSYKNLVSEVLLVGHEKSYYTADIDYSMISISVGFISSK